MQKAMRLSDYHYPYAILISKFLLYFEVNLEHELFLFVKSTQEMNNDSLSKMGFIKIGGKWISKDGDCSGRLTGIVFARGLSLRARAPSFGSVCNT